jgi:hypothetical protein
MVDIIKTHLKPIIAAAILLALLAVILVLLASDGVVATAFKTMITTIFNKGIEAGGF